MTTYAVYALIFLGLVAAIVRAWNAPAILAARKEIIDARAKKKDEQREDRAKAKAAKAAARAARAARRKRP